VAVTVPLVSVLPAGVPEDGPRVPQAAAGLPLRVKITGSLLTAPPPELLTTAVTVEFFAPSATTLDGLTVTVTEGAAGVVWVIVVEPPVAFVESLAVIVQNPTAVPAL
jgi:hypothetical protein